MGSLLRSLTTRFQSPAEEAAAGLPRRASLGLEQFLPAVTEVGHAAVLDLGCVWQATVSVFTGAGCKLYTEDLFAAFHQLRAAGGPEAPPLAERFFAGALEYPEGTFRGILAWDLFDYLPEELTPPLATRLCGLLEPGGVFLGLFHNRPEGVRFLRYRVLDPRTLELVPGTLPLRVERTYPNRALLNLFGAFRLSRTFVGRDNLRELLLVK